MLKLHLPKFSDIISVEAVQRKFTKRILAVSDLNYWDHIKKLNLQSMQRRRERYSIKMMWKMSTGNAPNNIGVKFYNNARLGKKVLGISPAIDIESKFFRFQNTESISNRNFSISKYRIDIESKFFRYQNIESKIFRYQNIESKCFRYQNIESISNRKFFDIKISNRYRISLGNSN